QGTTEGGFGIDDPVVAMQAAHEFCKLLRVGQSDGGTSAAELVAMVETFQTSQELATKDAAEDLDGYEDRIARADPATVVWRAAACGNDAVTAGLQEEVLCPSM